LDISLWQYVLPIAKSAATQRPKAKKLPLAVGYYLLATCFCQKLAANSLKKPQLIRFGWGFFKFGSTNFCVGLMDTQTNNGSDITINNGEL